MPTPPGYADCSYEYRQTGLTRPAYITFGVDPTDTDPALIAGSLQAAWAATGSLKSITDSSVTMSAVRVSLGTDGTGDLVTVLATNQAGGMASLTVPPNVAVLIHKSTSRGGRRGRGRMYLPWSVQSTQVDEGGQIVGSQVTIITTALGVWKTQLSTLACPLVLLHGPGKTALPAPDPVLSMSTDRLVATQRRRLGR